MFSPAKAVVAGALVFAIGGVLLIAQPFDQQSGRLPGAATDAAPQAPVEFTGHIECGEQVRGGKGEFIPNAAGSRTGLARERGGVWHQPATMSDPRLAGDYYISYDDDEYRGPEGTTSVGAGTWRIENDEGAWQGSYTVLNFADHTSPVTVPLVGEGAFQGLTTIWESTYDPVACDWEVRGLIIEGQPPAAPEAFRSE